MKFLCKTAAIVCLLALSLGQQACKGSADSGGGSGGAGTNPEVSTTLTFRVSGYSNDQTPQLYCGALGVDWAPIDFNQQGIASLTVGYLPQDLECNVKIGPQSWAVGKNGVCQDYYLWVNDLEITTWRTNDWGGTNYSFHVDADGTVSLVGDPIVYNDCTDQPAGGCSEKLDMTVQFSGYGSGVEPVVYCTGDGLGWDGIILDQNGQGTYQVCPASLECNVEMGAGDWAVASNGVCQGLSFSVNGTEISTWTPLNDWGGRNYSFRVNADASITPEGNNIVFKDCDGSTPGQEPIDLDIQFSGYQLGEQPVLYCAGDGLGWNQTNLDANGEASLSAYPDVFECNVQIGDNWAVGSGGLCEQYTFTVNGTEVTTGVGSLGGGQNYSFQADEYGNITAYGSLLTSIDCSDTSVEPGCTPQTISFEFYGGTVGDTPTLYCSGGGLGWVSSAFNSAGQTTLSACPGVFECNVQVNASTWGVCSEGLCDAYDLVANGTTITTGVLNNSGGKNYSFELLDSGTVEPWGSLLNVVDCDDSGSGNPEVTCTLEIVYDGSDLDPTFKIYGGGLEWTENRYFNQDGNTLSLVMENVHPDDFVANAIVNGTWYVNHQGMMAGHYFYANGEQLNYYESNNAGGNNLVFTLNNDCSVSLPGEENNQGDDTVPVDVIIDL